RQIQRLPSTLPFRHVSHISDNAGYYAFFNAINRSVEQDWRVMAVAMTNSQVPIPHGALGKSLFIRIPGSWPIAEVLGKGRADELLPHVAGGLLGGEIYIRNHPVGRNAHNRVEAGFDQASVVYAGPAYSLLRPPPLCDIPAHADQPDSFAGGIPEG